MVTSTTNYVTRLNARRTSSKNGIADERKGKEKADRLRFKPERLQMDRENDRQHPIGEHAKGAGDEKESEIGHGPFRHVRLWDDASLEGSKVCDFLQGDVHFLVGGGYDHISDCSGVTAKGENLTGLAIQRRRENAQFGESI